MAAGRWGPLSADEIQGLLNGNYYVNVHTSANPAGELRGHIIALLEEHYNGIRKMVLCCSNRLPVEMLEFVASSIPSCS